MFTYNARVLKVVDGDTLDVEIDLGFSVFIRERLRLLGVDTPETFGVKKDSEEYAAGMRAKARVEELLAGSGGRVMVVTVKDAKEKFGRYLANVFVEDIVGEACINNILLDEGLAKAYVPR